MPWFESSKGDRLWYEDHGVGDTVVLVHGWCMSSVVWKYQFDGLSASLRIIAPDLRGHGHSHGQTGNLDFDGFTKDLVELFKKLDLSKVILVGWSMGAQIALQACAELSERVAGLVLVSATPRFTASDDFPHGLAVNEASGMRLKVQRNKKRALDGFFSRLFAEDELVNCAHSSEIKQMLLTIHSPETSAVLDALDALTRADMRHFLADISIPTLIVNGELDRICLPQASWYLKEQIRGAEQMVFPDCGHAPFLTRYDQFNAEISRFARSVSE